MLSSKRFSVWQHISFVLAELIVISTLVISVLYSIDIENNLFSYGTFMFDFLDRYSNTFSLIIFNFGILVSSMIPESLAFNIAVTVFNIICCIALGFTAIYFYKPKAKIALFVWGVIIGLDLLISFSFMLSDYIFIFAFVVRAFLLFSMIKSLRNINANYEYYDI